MEGSGTTSDEFSEGSSSSSSSSSSSTTTVIAAAASVGSVMACLLMVLVCVLLILLVRRRRRGRRGEWTINIPEVYEDEEKELELAGGEGLKEGISNAIYDRKLIQLWLEGK